MFSRVKVNHIPIFNSDHFTILVFFEDTSNHSNVHFKFQVAWTTHHEFLEVIKENRSTNMDLKENLGRMEGILRKWSKTEFGNLEARKLKTLVRLGGIQKHLAESYDPSLIKLERKIKNQLEEILRQEEMMWHQRSREEHIALGDRNTKFYHVVAAI